MGRIGSRTVKRCVAFEMDVYVLDPNISEADIKKAGATKVTDLKAILPKVDFVSVHCPKSPETVNMFNAETLALMKPDAFLVNTARGGIINEEALYKALTSGKLRGAGLDVLDKEPPDAGNKLFGLENVILSPHMAGVTKEASDRMATTAIENILSVFDGQPDRGACREQGSAGLGAASPAARSSISSSVGKRPVLLRVYLSAPSTVTSNWPDLPGRSSMSVGAQLLEAFPHTEGLRLITSSAAIFDQHFHASKVGR